MILVLVPKICLFLRGVSSRMGECPRRFFLEDRIVRHIVYVIPRKTLSKTSKYKCIWLMKPYQNKILILYIIIVPIVEAQVAMLPQTYVDLTDEQALKDLQRTLDLLDEDDNVTDMWTNWNE